MVHSKGLTSSVFVTVLYCIVLYWYCIVSYCIAPYCIATTTTFLSNDLYGKKDLYIPTGAWIPRKVRGHKCGV